MRGRKNTVGKIYPKYQPYPLTWDLKEETYSAENLDGPHPGIADGEHAADEDFHNLIGESDRSEWFQEGRLPSSDEKPFRPLRLLRSLFTDRLNFLQRALDELEADKKAREHLIQRSLDELDPVIQDCELSLSELKASMNNSERRHNLERRLFELKRERRHEALMSWRDLVWLRGEIRKLQREIDAISRTAGSAENQQPPT